MRINHNISALKANNQLGITNKALDKSLEKLSSGYRINKAADDSAGLAISQKMKTQIAGLDQASRNASDGISVIQTAEGALSEVESMLQRMRELSVQAANGTNTAADRVAIQSEMDQLNEEIGRISNTTEFNTMSLLNGDIDRKSYSSDNSVNLISQSDTVSVGDYKLKVTQDARQAVVVGAATDLGAGATPETRKISAAEAGSITINGETVKVKEGDTINEVFEKMRNACDTVNASVFAVKASDVAADIQPTNNFDTAGYTSKPFEAGDRLVFVSGEYGSDQNLSIHCDNSSLCTILGMTIGGSVVNGYDADAELVLGNTSKFSSTATVSVKGNKITVTDSNDFSMVYQVDPGTVKTTFDDYKIDDTAVTNPVTASTDIKSITVAVLEAGPINLQIGANEDQTMLVRIPKVDPTTLGIDKINVGTQVGADAAINMLDKAINYVSAIRSKLGAYQNRLDHSISNLDVSSENMTESLSRIEDVDMAEEMASYTQKNVLAQAGTSMLAQANQRPQTILSLLQQ